MSEANKKVVRDFFAAMDSRRFDDMRALLHPDHMFHLPMAKEPMDLEAHMEMNIKIQHSLSDLIVIFTIRSPRATRWLAACVCA